MKKKLEYEPNGPVYSITEDEDKIQAGLFTIARRAVIHKQRGNRACGYYEIPASFDIETTNITAEEEHYGFMYHWQFGINGTVIFGRTWEQFLHLIDLLIIALNLSITTRLIVYIHNFSYEFQFVKKYFDWLEVFAKEPEHPVYAVTKSGIEFRCSYELTGYSLENLAKKCYKYHCEKKVGELDYKLIRTSETPLNTQEKGYCEADVRVIMNYIEEQIERCGGIKKIPLTKTAYVRQYIRNRCLPKDDPIRKAEYERLMDEMRLTVQEYDILKRAFNGGFTHANPRHAMDTVKDVTAYDFVSSYPACLVAFKYPMSRGTTINIKNKDDFEYNNNRYLSVFDIKLIGLKLKPDAPDAYISVSKCYSGSYDIITEAQQKELHYVVENGRVASADEVEITITNIDWLIISKIYTWEKMYIGKYIRYSKGYLPTPFILSVLELYDKKTELKDVQGAESEYEYYKTLLNAIYGLTVTDGAKDHATYNDGWEIEIQEKQKAITNYNTNRNRFTAYIWGVFCTAYARYNLWTGILNVGNDYVYCDTDSIYLTHVEAHKAYFDSYNTFIKGSIEKALKWHKIPVEMATPKNIRGEEKALGIWGFDGAYKKFKTLGAKRYLKQDYDNNYVLTVAGVGKKEALDYITSNYNDPFKAFNEELEIPAEHSGKLTHCYINYETGGTVIDYTGHVGEWHEESSIALYPAGYNLSVVGDFLNFINGIEEGYIK